MAEKAISGSLGTLKKAVQLALGPDLEVIKKDLSDLKSEVKVLGVKQEEMDKRLNSRIEDMDKRLNSRIEDMDKRLNGKMGEMDKMNSVQFESIRSGLRGLSEKVDWAKDIEKLKVEVAELKRRR